MFRYDYRDMVGGGVLVACGAFMAWHASGAYELGTVQRMGPGMFPMALGFLMAGFGLLLFVQAWFQRGEMPEVRIWSPIFVLAGVGAFALTIGRMGLIPAILAVTIVSSLAELKVRPVSLALLCVTLSVLAWLVFRVGLGLPLVMFRWPF